VSLKQRTFNPPATLLGTMTWPNGDTQQWHHQMTLGSEACLSDGHYGWQEPHMNVGGYFGLRRGKVSYGSCGASLSASNIAYSGLLIATTSAMSTPTTIVDGASYGATAYNRMKPAQPKFDGLNALAELRELPKMLRQRFSFDLMSAGNYWLALKFGWEPLWRDVRNLVTTQRQAQAYLRQLLRDNGKPIRRRITLLSDSSSTSQLFTGYNSFYPQFSKGFYVGVPVRLDTTTVTDTIWASARFRYWLPQGSPRDIYWTRKMLSRIYGLHLRPSVVYNAIPWTWMIDWFSGLGDAVSNLDSGVADRLAADYIYVMREKKTERVSQATGNFKTSTGSVSLSAVSTGEQVTKSRVRGSPFGFGITESSLSPMQWSILGALGMSRLG
jgi:hypothetical protein